MRDEPQGFWLTVQSSHWGYVHIPAVFAAKAIDDLLAAPEDEGNSLVTLHVELI